MFIKFKSIFQRKRQNKIQKLDTDKDKVVNNKKKRKLFGDDQQLSHLQQFDKEDKESKFNKNFIVNDDFDGIIRNRIVTDKYYIHLTAFIFIIFLSRVIMIFLQSDLYKISFPQDYRAQECGLKHLKNKKYLYYLLPNIHLELKMCVDQCPQSTNKQICLYREDGIKEHTEERFCYSTIQSRKIGKICVPVETNTRKSVLNFQNLQRNFLRNLLGDIHHVIYLIILCFIGIILIQNLISFLIQIPKISILINILVFIIGILGISSFWLYLYFDYLKYISKFCYQKVVTNFCLNFKGNFMFYSTLIIISFVIVFIFYILFYIKKIIISFKFLKNLEKIYRKTRTLISFYSFIQILLILFSVFYLNFILAWFSQGKVDKVNINYVDGGKVKVYKFYDYNYALLIFDIFLLLLIINIIVNYNRVITIFSVTDWYFTRKKMATNFKVNKLQKIFFLYHFGTFLKFTIFNQVFGPFKFIIEILISFLKLLNNDLDIIRFFMSLLFPLLYFYHKFLKYIDYGLFVHVLLWGNNYNKSSIKNYFLQLRKKEYKTQHIYWVKLIGRVQFLGSCCLICSLLYFLIYYVGNNEGSYFENLDQCFTVIFCTLIFSQFLNSGFYDNFFFMQQTIMQCFMIDIEMFFGEQLYYENLFDNFAKKYQDYSIEISNDHSIFGFQIKKKKNKKYSMQIQAIQNQSFEEDSSIENKSKESLNKEDQSIKSKSGSSQKEEESFKEQNQIQLDENSIAKHSRQNLQNFDEISKN